MGRDANRGLVQETRISASQIRDLSKERTLFVEGVPVNWPCYWVAVYVLRAALEQGCTKIVLKKGRAGHRHDFDVVDLLANCKREAGGYLHHPTLARVPRLLATRGHQRNGSTLDTTRTVVRVPIAVSG